MHQARVATRRLREAVPVLSAGLKHSKAGKASRKIRRLTRALGTVRELDVTLHLLDELTRTGNHARTALEEVRAHVVAERDRRRTVMLERLAGVNPDKLGRRLASVADAVEGAAHEKWRAVLSSRLLRRSRRLSAAVETAGQMYAPERLHQVRIAAKKLRYGVELAGDSGMTAAVPLLRPIKRAQDLLGRLHDLHVLQTHVAAVQAGPAADRPGIHSGLDGLARHIEDECRHLHGRYLMSARSLRETCEVIESRLVPAMQKLPRRRPVKMALRRKPRTLMTGTGR